MIKQSVHHGSIVQELGVNNKFINGKKVCPAALSTIKAISNLRNRKQ